MRHSGAVQASRPRRLRNANTGLLGPNRAARQFQEMRMTTFTHLPASDLPDSRLPGTMALTLLTGALALSLAAFTLADVLSYQTAAAHAAPARLPVAASTLAPDTSVPAARADGPGVHAPLPPTF